jgi:hypothetical protein
MPPVPLLRRLKFMLINVVVVLEKAAAFGGLFFAPP